MSLNMGLTLEHRVEGGGREGGRKGVGMAGTQT